MIDSKSAGHGESSKASFQFLYEALPDNHNFVLPFLPRRNLMAVEVVDSNGSQKWYFSPGVAPGEG